MGSTNMYHVPIYNCKTVFLTITYSDFKLLDQLCLTTAQCYYNVLFFLFVKTMQNYPNI